MKCNIPDNDLNQRLNSTVCRYNGLPVHVKSEGGNTLSLWSLSSGDSVGVIKSNDPGFDISGVPLGFVQIGPGTVVYVSRKAARIYKQGVSQDALSVKYISPLGERTPRFQLFSRAFEDSVLGRFPPLDVAKKLLREQKNGQINTDVAISRDVALSYSHDMELTHVFYKDEKVGFIVKEDNTVITPTKDYGWIISKNLSSFDWKVE